MNGFFLVDKPAGLTSFDVCARLRRRTGQKKMGHSGTLDPFATGLLLVAAGKCTRLLSFVEKHEKTYLAQIRIGQTSPTLDPESEIISCAPAGFSLPSREEIEKVLAENFLGEISQIPPKFSAIKIDGKRAHQLARSGENIEMKPRKTKIFSTQVRQCTQSEILIEMRVAAGFYVRSFARDLGLALGAGGGMCQNLRRTKIGDLDVGDAENWEIAQPIDPKYILDLPQTSIPTGRIQDFVAGRAFPHPGVENQIVLVLCGGKSVGVGTFVAGKLQPKNVI